MLTPVFSIAKTFTAAAVLTADIRLDAQVGEYVECPREMRASTVRSLLNHTSGLPDYGNWPDYRDAVAARQDAWTVNELLDRAAAKLKPAGQFAYSNVGYTLVRLLLQNVTGQPDLFSALQRTVFSRLDMHDVSPLRSRADWAGVTPSSVLDLADYDPDWVFPGTFLASPEAIETGFRQLFRGALFDPMLLLDVVPVSAPGHVFTEPGYGLGVMASGNPPRIVGHGGGGPGFTIVAVATRDGAHAAVEWAASEVSDQPLFQAALERLSA